MDCCWSLAFLSVNTRRTRWLLPSNPPPFLRTEKWPWNDEPIPVFQAKEALASQLFLSINLGSHAHRRLSAKASWQTSMAGKEQPLLALWSSLSDEAEAETAWRHCNVGAAGGNGLWPMATSAHDPLLGATVLTDSDLRSPNLQLMKRLCGYWGTLVVMGFDPRLLPLTLLSCAQL